MSARCDRQNTHADGDPEPAEVREVPFGSSGTIEVLYLCLDCFIDEMNDRRKRPGLPIVRWDELPIVEPKGESVDVRS